MHSDQPYIPFKPKQSLADHQLGYYMQNAPMATKPVMPLRTVDIQLSDACPRNFIIFDLTTNGSQIMFHPEATSKLLYPAFGVDNVFQDNTDQNDEAKIASPLKEDSDDIDAILSSEYDEIDDNEVSTARTSDIYGGNSPDSCSNYESLPGKSGSCFEKSCGGRYSDKKRKRMRKMVKALRGIVPGGKRMSNVTVLDEAVRYLKSLRVEVQNMELNKF